MSWGAELRAQLRLGVPVVVLQLGMAALGFVDVAFLGRVSAEHLAAVTLGNAWATAWTVFGWGVLTAVDPLTSQAWGARDEEGFARALQRGLLLALALSLPLGAAVYFVGPVLRASGQSPDVLPIAVSYARVVAASLPPYLGFLVVRIALQSRHRTRALLVVVLVANALNALLDWLFIAGGAGGTARGAVGCAWATVGARWAMLLGLLLVARLELAPLLRPRPGVLAPRALLSMLRIGLPVGVQYAAELAAFAALALVVGRLGAQAVGAHQVAFSYAVFAAMVPVGLSMAASVRVGNEVGRGDPAGARRAAAVAFATGMGSVVPVALVLVLAPRTLGSLFTDAPGVLDAAAVLLPVIALYQTFDAVQIVACGVLRGVGDTRVPMLVHLASHWAVGLPLGGWLALGAGAGVRGAWVGMAAALVVVAPLLALRVRRRLAGELARLAV